MKLYRFWLDWLDCLCFLPSDTLPFAFAQGLAGRTNASAPTQAWFHLGKRVTLFCAGVLLLWLLHARILLYMQFYRRNLPHLQKDFTPHFITFVTKFRWILPPIARDIVLESCRHDHRKKYELYVAVIMPDHVHLILTPLIDERRREVFSITKIMQTIKGASARAINQRLRRTGPVWQEESFDHILRSSEGLDAKVDYILQNPVRRGLVDTFQTYRWTWQTQDRPIAEMRTESRIL